MPLVKKLCKCGKTYPNYGVLGGEPLYCGKCKTSEMRHLRCKLCDCGKRPTFGYEADGKALFCAKCRKENTIDLKNQHLKCKCGNIMCFALPGEKKPVACKVCRTDLMIDVKNTYCECEAHRQPTYGFPTDKKPTKCGFCKVEGMVNIKTKKCECGKKTPNYGFITDKSARYCLACKKDGMININASRCIVCKIRHASFAIKGIKTPTHCAGCKTSDLVDITHPLCPGPPSLINEGGCPYTQYGNKIYDNYCTACFRQAFPKDIRSNKIRNKSYEIIVREALIEEFEDIEFIHDKPLYIGGCDCSHRRRVDFRTLIGNTLLCIEVDENQHKNREENYEEVRYNDIMMVHGGKFVFIRMNPNMYIDLKGRKIDIDIEDKCNSLCVEIYKQIDRIESDLNVEMLEIVKMYFDEMRV